MAETCPSCGVAVPHDSAFCSHCGSQVGEAVPSTRVRRPSAESIATGEQRLLKALRDATLGEYEVLSEIGRGGMAVVFLAHDVALDRRVAIKVMSPALMLMDKGIQDRFKREARTAASLSHPHIIPVYAVKESPDLVYFVMKYIEGRSLESVLKETGPLPIPVVQTILSQAGSALGLAHQRGVVHRDVKPGNVMLEEGGWVVVADFGIAKVAEAKALTMTGGMVGTPAYMSPEQCSGGEVTGAADQYSLGIVAYEMITGRPPFLSKTVVNMIYDHCHSPPPPLVDARPDCPPALAAAVMKMIDKEPNFRFPTIEDAVAAVGEVTESADTVRTQMLTLAQSPATAQLLDKFRTPGSMTPRPATPDPASVAPPPLGARTPATPTPSVGTPLPAGAGASRRSWMLWGIPVVLAAALGGVFTLGRGGAGTSGQPAGVAGPGPAVARLDVMPLSLSLKAGEQAQLTAAPRDSVGGLIAGAVAWEALDQSVASVSGDGTVRAMSPGQGRVVARLGGNSATVVVTVTSAPRAVPAAAAAAPRSAPASAEPASVAVAPSSLTLTVGGAARLSATPRAADGTALPDRAITWTSTDPAVVTVGPDGLVTAVAAGTARITGTSDRVSGSATVTVPAPVVVAAAPERALSQPPAVVASAPAAAAPQPAPAPADPRPEIAAVIERYAQAITARDVEAIRRLYPGLTPQQERAWRDFFGSVSELSAELSIASLETSGATARAVVDAVYDFRANRRQTQNTSFTMELRRGTTGWQIVTVQ